jgi:ABC-type multidrug transport system fused ATPase/permease subunit
MISPAAERVFALIDAEQAVIQNDHKSAPMLNGEIRFDGITFARSDSLAPPPPFFPPR